MFRKRTKTGLRHSRSSLGQPLKLRSSSRESAGDWSRPNNTERSPIIFLKADAARQRSTILTQKNSFLSLVNQQLVRLQSEHSIPPKNECSQSSAKPETPEPEALVKLRGIQDMIPLLAPPLALLIAAFVSTVSAVVGSMFGAGNGTCNAFWSGWPFDSTSCQISSSWLSRLLPSWSAPSNSPLIRPF